MKVFLIVASAYYGTAFFSPPMEAGACKALKDKIIAFYQSRGNSIMFVDCAAHFQPKE